MNILEEIKDSKNMSLEEASNSRLVQKFTDDSTFAIISGSRPDNDRTPELKKDVRSLGLGFNEFTGRWVENGENFDENSLLISNIDYKTAFKLSQKYEQSSFIFKDKDEVKEICTTPFENYNVGDVVREYSIDPNKPLNTQIASEIFSGKRDTAASQLKKGGNKKPFNFGIKENFELYEKVLINSRLGFTNTKINL